MKLTAETFQQIVESLHSDPSAGGRELRKNPRVGVRGRATIVIAGRTASKMLDVTLRDISVNGIGLMLSDPLKVGDQFVLILPGSKQTAQRAMLCLIKRVVIVSEFLFNIGAAFVREVQVNTNLGQPVAVKPVRSASDVPVSIGKSSLITQGISDAMLSSADSQEVSDLERRLAQSDT